MPMAKNVIKISPPVPRRKGWDEEDEETSVFHIKFKTERGRDEVSQRFRKNNFQQFCLIRIILTRLSRLL